jgi:hypothetical protein
MLRIAKAALVAACLGGCSSIPDVEYTYYPSKASASVSVSQTIACNPGKTDLVIVSIPTISAAYAADTGMPPYRIRIGDIEGGFGSFADSEATFKFSDDGRLLSINQSTTGQGETVVKAAVGVGTSILTFHTSVRPPKSNEEKPAASAELPVCKFIADWGAGKPVTLTYGAEFDPLDGGSIDIKPSQGSQSLYAAINSMSSLPRLTAVVGPAVPIASRARNIPDADEGSVKLTLRKTAKVDVKVRASSTIIRTTANAVVRGTANTVIGGGTIIVPTKATYTVPIPRAAFFGKQSFAMTLSDAGDITSITYGKLSGAAAALNAGNSIATVKTTDTTAEVAQLKAKADLIAQRQRLLKCEAEPGECK